LSWNVDEDMLSQEFAEFGEIVRCTVMLRDDGKSKGYVF
jgi:RNA recognition motif-containing protein